MEKLRELNLLEDERGGGTFFGLLWFMLLVGITGLAVDTTDGFHTKTALQATADAASLAASIDLPDETTALATAMVYAGQNMPAAQYGNVLAEENVQFGVWDEDTRTLNVGETPANAVRVLVQRTEDNGNALPANFLRIIGLNTWNVSAEAVAQRFIPLSDAISV